MEDIQKKRNRWIDRDMGSGKELTVMTISSVRALDPPYTQKLNGTAPATVNSPAPCVSPKRSSPFPLSILSILPACEPF